MSSISLVDEIITCREEVLFISLESGYDFFLSILNRLRVFADDANFYKMITTAVFAFAIYQPGNAFKDIFGASLEEVHKARLSKCDLHHLRLHSCQINKLQ